MRGRPDGAGHIAFRGSSPNRKQVFEDALTQTGTPRSFDRPCLHYVVCPHQFVWLICALASFMLPTSTSARCISRFDATTLWHLDAAEWAPSTASFATDAFNASVEQCSPRKRRSVIKMWPVALCQRAT
jgi:hypothetical protein